MESERQGRQMERTEKKSEAGIRLSGLTVGYKKQPVVKDIAFMVRPGEIYTLIGPNGAGKSTILKSIVRELDILGGAVYLEGTEMATMTERQVAKRLSMVMTERLKTELLSCREVVASGRYPYTGSLGILSREDWKKVDEALRLVQAEEVAEQDFMSVSDGQRQRVMLARALCQEPRVLILDEPTSYLDIRYKLELMTVLRKMVEERQLAVIMSLHELDLARKISDVVVCVKGDFIEAMGPPEEIFAGNFVEELYDIRVGSYDSLVGEIQLPRISGEPEVFVIGGGGSGIAQYYQLQRQGIPFAAGVIAENDVEYPVARALASVLISEKPWQVMGEDKYREALAVMEKCRRVICTLDSFGPVNDVCRRLAMKKM